MYKKVLVPLDGSKLAESAMNHVKNLITEGFIGEVTLFNVVKVDIPWFDDLEKFKQSSRKYLADVASRLASEDIKVKTESVEANSPANAISEYAYKNGMDMIVIATHGYTGGMTGILLGSVAFGVLHQSRVPVLLIRPESLQV